MARVDLMYNNCRCWPPTSFVFVPRRPLLGVHESHLAELPNKIGLPSEQYMRVQDIDAGWACLALPAWARSFSRRRTTSGCAAIRAPFSARFTAFLCIVATQLSFWLFTFPLNVASANWTRTPAAFEAAHRQWEYSHATSAVFTIAALIAILAALLLASRPSSPAA
jgi:hypothetical protein